MTSSPAAPDAVPTVVCGRCGESVPFGNFCGSCGADSGVSPDDRLAELRPRVYAVAPEERVLLPMVTSTLFPQLPQVYRNPFRIGMIVMLVGVLGFSMLRLLGPLVILVALGVPVLFMLYLWQSDVLQDISARSFAVAAVLGGALGIGWVVLTGGLVARSYGIPMAAGFVLQDLMGVGLLITVGGAILMVVPTVVVRMLRPADRESLDGFVIGVLGSLSFTGAATTARLAPQFVSGLIDNVRPVRLLIEAILYGVAAPLTAASAGGLIGIVLWFRPDRRALQHPRRVRALLLVFAGLVLVIYTGIWSIDAARLPLGVQFGLHLVMTVIALLVARACVQLALLHEQPDRFSGHPLLCVHCDRVVPDMAFCPACGVAARAASRVSRRQRRESPPRRDLPPRAAEDV